MRALRTALQVLLLTLAVLWPVGAATAQGLLRDTEIEATLRDLADPILLAAGLDPKQVEIYLVNDPDMNAFVAGGQNMFYHSGLIIEADSYNELLGVIAHETGHISGGHLARFAQDAGRSAAVPTLVAIGLGALAIAAGAPDAGAALIGGSTQFGLASVLSYRQDQEAAADQSAAAYLRAVGEPIDGLITFMERFRDLEAFSQARRYGYFRTHPLAATRVSALNTQKVRFPLEGWEADATRTERFEFMKAKLIGFLQPLGRVLRKYPESNDSLPAIYARAIATFQAGDMPRSLALTARLIEAQPDNPYFHELHGQSLFETGRIVDSIAPHRRAVELHEGSALLLVNLARSLIASNDTLDSPEVVEAEALLRRAVVYEPNNAFAWLQLATAYDRLGRPGDARLAAAEAAYVRGARPEALSFARRAQAELEPGTPAFQRASDIVALADPRNRYADGVFR
jgi:predicted Zn-dependent protease